MAGSENIQLQNGNRTPKHQQALSQVEQPQPDPADPARHQTDEEIVRLALYDKQQYGILAERYAPKLKNYLKSRFFLDIPTAEDIAQESFLKAFVNLGKFDFEKTWQTWLFAIATNGALDYFRRQKSYCLQLSGVETIQFAAQDRDIDKILSAQQVNLALSALTVRQQSLIRDYLVLGLSWSQILSKRKIKKAALKKELHCAIVCLRKNYFKRRV